MVLKHLKSRDTEKNNYVTTLDWKVSFLLLVLGWLSLIYSFMVDFTRHHCLWLPIWYSCYYSILYLWLFLVQREGTLLGTCSFGGQDKIWIQSGKAIFLLKNNFFLNFHYMKDLYGYWNRYLYIQKHLRWFILGAQTWSVILFDFCILPCRNNPRILSPSHFFHRISLL